MRKIIVSEFMTLDGIIEAPQKWSFQFAGEEQPKYKFDEIFASDGLLLGRVTYQGFAAAWPNMTGTGDYGLRMNSIAKYVVSTTLKDGSWNNSTVISNNVMDEIARLKQQPGQDLLVFGSATLAQSLMKHDLVDEYRLMIFPIVLGSGRRLFADGGDTKVLKLTDIRKFSTGVVVHSYQPAK